MGQSHCCTEPSQLAYSNLLCGRKEYVIFCKNVVNGNIVMYFMVGILSLKGNLIFFAIIIFTFFILGYPQFINNIVFAVYIIKCY